MRTLTRPAFTIDRSDTIKARAGRLDINEGDDDALTLHFDRYDTVVIAARLARHALEAIDADHKADGVSDEPSTRAEGRAELEQVIVLAAALVRTLADADAEETADHSDIGRVMAAHSGENVEMYP